jgi:hypothetical protein
MFCLMCGSWEIYESSPQVFKCVCGCYSSQERITDSYLEQHDIEGNPIDLDDIIIKTDEEGE